MVIEVELLGLKSRSFSCRASVIFSRVTSFWVIWLVGGRESIVLSFLSPPKGPKKRPLRLVTSVASPRPITPPNMCTTAEPAKSITALSTRTVP